MKRANSILALFITVLLSGPGMATSAFAKTFNLKKLGSVELTVPSHWQEVTDMIGMPLMILGPDNGATRPVLSVIPTGNTQIKFDPTGLAATQEDFKKGRIAYVEGHDGEVLSFDSYRKESWKGVSEVHAIGVHYEMNDTEYNEQSYYVVCKDKLYFLKTLIRSQDEKLYGSTLTTALRSFTCS